MRKFISCMIAAAMVLSMGVSAVAAEFSAPATGKGVEMKIAEDGSNFAWGYCHLFRDEAYVTSAKDSDDMELKAEDVLYFDVYYNNEMPKEMASNWIVKINNAEYIEDAELAMLEGRLTVKVTLADDFNEFEEAEDKKSVEFWMYVEDTVTKAKTEKANVHYSFDAYETEIIYKNDIDDVVEVKPNTYYKLDKGMKSQDVVLEIVDGVFVTVKMYEGEKYLVRDVVDATWSKELSKEYNTDVEIITIDTDFDVREILFESNKDNKQVVEITGNTMTIVNAEYVTRYEMIKNVFLAKGYIADAKDNGAYALIDKDVVVDDIVEVDTNNTTEVDKANPETGAGNVYGVAVAGAVMAVIAGAAIYKKH